jgi:rhamnopyranosyl-N-acetylglucosaminyl-diphospho-decaprenol beta-1,3/1,4-galactofuranosyltransferase
MTTLAAFILTYKRPAGLERSIEAMLAQSRRPDRIAVVDNATDPATKEQVQAWESEGITYHPTGANLGSAGGVAFGLRLLADEGYDWVLSIDDDDPPRHPQAVERLVELLERNQASGVGIVGTAGSYFSWDTGEHVRIPDADLRGDLDVDIIGGGSCFTVSRTVIEDVGVPNPDFFFGHYDPLFCLQVKRAGYRVMVSGELMHDFRFYAGRTNLTAVRGTVVPTTPPHAAWRRYYVTRNYIHAMRRTFGEPRLARRHAAKALVHSATSWRRGPRFGLRFTTMQVRGVVDGYLDRLGPRVAPVAKPT